MQIIMGNASTLKWISVYLLMAIDHLFFTIFLLLFSWLCIRRVHPDPLLRKHQEPYFRPSLVCWCCLHCDHDARRSKGPMLLRGIHEAFSPGPTADGCYRCNKRRNDLHGDVFLHSRSSHQHCTFGHGACTPCIVCLAQKHEVHTMREPEVQIHCRYEQAKKYSKAVIHTNKLGFKELQNHDLEQTLKRSTRTRSQSNRYLRSVVVQCFGLSANFVLSAAHPHAMPEHWANNETESTPRAFHTAFTVLITSCLTLILIFVYVHTTTCPHPKRCCCVHRPNVPQGDLSATLETPPLFVVAHNRPAKRVKHVAFREPAADYV
uniref:uncharacterized protein isoform X2 n=1 Tax=Myxine glutinosa TaxID=7769 RepID=UPI00358FC61D